MNAACDVCSRPTSWEAGTSYTADEFRALVARGFEPDETMDRHAAMWGMTRETALRQWKGDLVARSTTGWLLCPGCALRAGHFGSPSAPPTREEATKTESFEPMILRPAPGAMASPATAAPAPGAVATLTAQAPTVAPPAGTAPVGSAPTISPPPPAYVTAPVAAPAATGAGPAGFCAWCGAPRRADDRFCGQCGTDLAAPVFSDRAGSSTVAPPVASGAAGTWAPPAGASRPKRTGSSAARRALVLLAAIALAIGGGAWLSSQGRLPAIDGSPSTPDTTVIQAEAAICAPALQGVTNYRFYQTVSDPDPTTSAALRLTAAGAIGSYAAMVSDALAQAPAGIDGGIRSDAQAVSTLLPLDPSDAEAVAALGDALTRLNTGCAARS